MKKFYFLFFLTIGFLSNSQIVNIPDANFKAKLLSTSSGNVFASTETPIYNSSSNSWSVSSYNAIDINGDGEIQITEAQLIKFLQVPYSNITSLVGLEAFVNLEFFNCEGNNVQSLDLTQNTEVKYLQCSYNQINSLILSQCLNLTQLHCYNNNLVAIDLTQNTALNYLFCSTNQLTNLDLTSNRNLESLIINYNQITELNLTNNLELKYLSCLSNQIVELDVSKNKNLEYLDCSYNQLIYLFLKNNNVIWDYYTSNNGNTLIFAYNPNLIYVCADIEDINMVQQKVNSYNLINCHVNDYCSFTPGGTFYEISGTTKLDSNNNGCDVSDINYSNLRFNIANGTNLGSMISNQTGNYHIPVQAGNHTITPNLENPNYFNISPASFTANFPTQASPFTQDFCVTASGVHHDVEVIILPTVPARPGFDANYKLVYSNKGNQIENGSISFTFDDARLDYVTANPVYNSSAANSFTWNYTNLQPFETREIALVLNVNSPMEIPAVNNGDQINFLAEITPFTNDEIQYDNISALKQIVVGSYDPNDKTCLEGTTITPTEVGNYVHYVIRFENTGTFPAENIVVKDMIDLNKFDIATLVPLKSSHDFYTRINGNKVEFIFENINLDFNDATNDGYVIFKIKTKPTLVLGDTFTNNANIYFDYNFPITTNTYTTTVAALSTQDFDFGTYFTLYPNPAKDVLNIQTKQGLAINSIEIYNQLGQIVMAVTNAVNAVDVANLASGTYFVKVNTEKGSANAKFVKE
ncbi:T9SS type A sorting domain-containing protein [Flavobacterium cheniae]|uniref:T9SS type A sorting domain-containing protein n=1 Tax=Flavobacterium cheniae TaxID=295428 RepID=UPI00105E8776|nr:T9SS type A sorting domain-containing protein [Flavobacterium cheniae]TDR25482.1 putative repeat protein (TIGR01451 family)/predicted secreted protein (Por secretion system target) [Flavobacterium cheniae]